MMIKKIAINTILAIATLLLCLLVFEVFLRTGLLDGKDKPNPIWIPHKFDKINEEINQKNWQLAKLNPYKFTDKIRDIEKKNNVTRIAVLGDSFVWGTGLPYELVWSHKLENTITAKHNNFEVMNWGLFGWSTIDQLSFLEKHGIKYNIDILIVGFVDNDPDIKDITNKIFTWDKFVLINGLKVVFPNAISFLRSYFYKFLFRYYTDYGYVGWVSQLYSDENLLRYSEVLQDLSQFCNSKNIKLYFALTPTNYDEYYRKHFDKIIPLLNQAHIKYVDLYPAVKTNLGHIQTRELWANPGDPHPGTLLTDLFSNEVYNYLKRQGIFSPDKPSNEQITASTGTRPRHIETVVNTALNDDDWDVRKKSAIELGKTNDPYAVNILIESLQNRKAEVRESAADALGEIKDYRSIPALLLALKDRNPYVRKRAILALENKMDPRIIDSLITTATQDIDKYVRKRAILLLTNFSDPRVVETMIHMLTDDFFYNRETAATALGKIKDPRAVLPLIALLNDKIPSVRIAAAGALGEIKDSQAVEPLKTVSLHDEDLLIRDIAADAVKKITGEEFGKYRRKLLRMWETM